MKLQNQKKHIKIRENTTVFDCFDLTRKMAEIQKHQNSWRSTVFDCFDLTRKIAEIQKHQNTACYSSSKSNSVQFSYLHFSLFCEKCISNQIGFNFVLLVKTDKKWQVYCKLLIEVCKLIFSHCCRGNCTKINLQHIFF